MICNIKVRELFNVAICKTIKLHVRLMLCTERTSFKRHIRSNLKKASKTLHFSGLITGKTSTEITLMCCWHDASQYAESSDIQTVENDIKDNKTIRRLGERFNASDVTSDSEPNVHMRLLTTEIGIL